MAYSPIWIKAPRRRLAHEHQEHHAARSQPYKIEANRRDQVIDGEDVAKHDGSHALENVSGGQAPGDILQPPGQNRDGVIDRTDRRQDEHRKPGNTFSPKPVAQDQPADRESDRPTHDHEQGKERDQRQAKAENRVMVKRNCEERRRHDADGDTHEAHENERDHPFVRPQRRREEMAQIARPHLLEKRY